MRGRKTRVNAVQVGSCQGSTTLHTEVSLEARLLKTAFASALVAV